MHVHRTAPANKESQFKAFTEDSIDMSRLGHVTGEMYSKIIHSLLTRLNFTIKERERELRGLVFGIKEAFNAFGLVYDKSMISTPSLKTRER